MILVDDQAGSKDLYPYVARLTPDTLLTRIDPPYGDLVWDGNGPGGLCRVAVEYKMMAELLTSIDDGRFVGHQVGGLIEYYDRRYLLINISGYRFDRESGVLMRRAGRDVWHPVMKGRYPVTHTSVEHWITTIEEQAQFRVKVVDSANLAARWVVDKHSWWTGKEWSQHGALCKFHTPPPPTIMVFGKPTLVRRVAKEFYKIEWKKAEACEQVWPTVIDMVNADLRDWEAVPGIGKIIASNIYKEIRGIK